MVETPRLRLQPLDAALDLAQQQDRAGFFSALGVEPEAAWPPDMSDICALRRDISPDNSDAGWGRWVFISPVMNRLAGAGGFSGAPGPDGAIEIGYSMLISYREQGLATEAVLGLIGWAYAQPGVKRITAHTPRDNAASRRVLEKAGFVETGKAQDPETGEELVAFEHKRAKAAA